MIKKNKIYIRNYSYPMLLFVVLLIGCTMNVSAFFAFDRVDIDQ